MINEAARLKLIAVISDPRNSPAKILGASVAFASVCGTTARERRLADALEAAYDAEITAMKADAVLHAH